MEFTEVVVVKSSDSIIFWGAEITYKQTHPSQQTNTKGCYMFSEQAGWQGLQEINLWANILSDFIKNHVIPKELSTGATNSSTW